MNRRDLLTGLLGAAGGLVLPYDPRRIYSTPSVGVAGGLYDPHACYREFWERIKRDHEAIMAARVAAIWELHGPTVRMSHSWSL